MLLLLFAVFAAAGAVRQVIWVCLLLLPFRIILPPDVGHVVGFENLFLVSDLLIPLTFGIWLLRRLVASRGGVTTQAGRLFPKILPLLLIAFLLSYRPGISGRDFLSDLEKWGVYVLAFVLVSQACRTEGHLVRTVNVLMVGGALVTIRDLGAYLSIFNLPYPLNYAPNRDAYLFSLYDIVRYQGSGWPFFINTLFLFSFARLSMQRSMKTVERVALLIFCAVLFFLLVLSLYRGDWLALGAALLTAVGLRRDLLRKMIPVAAIAIVIAMIGLSVVGTGIMAEVVPNRFRTLLSFTEEEHVINRFDAFVMGWHMFLDHPLTGVGLGQYGNNFFRYSRYQLGGTVTDPSYFRQANNEFAQYLATTGLLGFAGFIGLFATFLARAYWLVRARLNDRLKAIAFGCLLSVVAFLTTSLSQNPTWDKTYGTLLFTVFGMIWAIATNGDPRSCPSLDPVPKTDENRPSAAVRQAGATR